MVEKIKKFVNRRGQVTAFIILAIILVVIIIMLFILLRGKFQDATIVDIENPQQYIDLCVKDATNEAVEILMKNAGYLKPGNTKFSMGRNVTYLCYNANYYYKCINQEPMLIEHIEEEILTYIKPKIEECFSGLQTSLEAIGYEVAIGEMSLSDDLSVNKIRVNVDREFKINKGEIKKEFIEFRTEIIHPIYDLAQVAQEIVNQEARFCNFEYLGYMIFYPEYDIRKFVTSDGIKIYTIKDIVTEEEFEFAIKSCAIPAGLG